MIPLTGGTYSRYVAETESRTEVTKGWREGNGLVSV